MKVSIEITEKDLRILVAAYIEDKLGDVPLIKIP